MLVPRLMATRAFERRQPRRTTRAVARARRRRPGLKARLNIRPFSSKVAPRIRQTIKSQKSIFSKAIHQSPLVSTTSMGYSTRAGLFAVNQKRGTPIETLYSKLVGSGVVASYTPTLGQRMYATMAEDEHHHHVAYPDVGSKAPSFKVDAVVGEEFKTISLEDYAGKWVVLFFYPLDFTFVCPTEIVEFSNKVDEFRNINTEILGVSVDSKFSHLAWTNTPREQGGIGKINFPLLADINKHLAADYDALYMDTGHTLRATYIIDPEGVIRHITKNDPPVGRNVDETLRLVRAYQYVREHGEVCPVNWAPGGATMKADPVESKEYFAKHGK